MKLEITSHKKILYTIAYMIGILGFASVPDTPDKTTLLSLNAIMNNCLHVPAYGILVFLWFRALYQKSRSKQRSIIYAVGITMAFGILQELVQSFVRGRFMSLGDIGLNTISIALAVLYIHKYQRI
jgi:VanZ family protein